MPAPACHCFGGGACLKCLPELLPPGILPSCPFLPCPVPHNASLFFSPLCQWNVTVFQKSPLLGLLLPPACNSHHRHFFTIFKSGEWFSALQPHTFISHAWIMSCLTDRRERTSLWLGVLPRPPLSQQTPRLSAATLERFLPSAASQGSVISQEKCR